MYWWGARRCNGRYTLKEGELLWQKNADKKLQALLKSKMML